MQYGWVPDRDQTNPSLGAQGITLDGSTMWIVHLAVCLMPHEECGGSYGKPGPGFCGNGELAKLKSYADGDVGAVPWSLLLHREPITKHASPLPLCLLRSITGSIELLGFWV